MPNFELEKIETITSGKLVFHKLVRKGVCFYDEFVEENTIGRYKNNKSDIMKIMAIMDMMAQDDGLMPKTWFRPIKGVPNGFEFKSGSLRLYCIKEIPDVIVVLGGFKGKQKKDIKKFDRIISEYIKEKELDEK